MLYAFNSTVSHTGGKLPTGAIGVYIPAAAAAIIKSIATTAAVTSTTAAATAAAASTTSGYPKDT